MRYNYLPAKRIFVPTIIYTTEDPAGKTIARQLQGIHSFKELAPIPLPSGGQARNWDDGNGVRLLEIHSRLATESEFLSRLPFLSAESFAVFVSRHRAESGKPALTVHCTGNWGNDAKWGGRPGELARTSAHAATGAFRFLAETENRLEGFDVEREATHHGPSGLSCPSLFIELGSSGREWGLTEPAGIVAKTAIRSCEQWGKSGGGAGKVAVAFGGPHYCPAFKEAMLGGEYAVSHIGAKYALDGISKELIAQAMEKTLEPIEAVLVDWKGTTKTQREIIVQAAIERNVPVERM